MSVCFVCGKGRDAAALKRCTRCECAVYCSRECQLSGWQNGGHKRNCASLKLTKALSKGYFGGCEGGGLQLEKVWDAWMGDPLIMAKMRDPALAKRAFDLLGKMGRDGLSTEEACASDLEMGPTVRRMVEVYPTMMQGWTFSSPVVGHDDDAASRLLGKKRFDYILSEESEPAGQHWTTRGDCPICLERLPLDVDEHVLMTCCGKKLCRGCTTKKSSSSQSEEACCPSCRALPANSPAEQLRRMEKRSAAGCAASQCQLAKAYRNGLGVRANAKKALTLFKLASAAGDVDATFNLGCIHEFGEGVPVSLAKAAGLYRKAADVGFPSAQLNLGYLLGRSGGGGDDQAEASRLNFCAAQQGNPPAMHNRGFELQNQGDGPGACKWYKHAATKGIVQSAMNFGALYYDGTAGVAKNRKLGKQWIKWAADRGDTVAASLWQQIKDS